MHVVVYVPFAASLVVVVLARLAAPRLWPRAVAWAITVSGAALAACTVAALALLALPLAARLPLVAAAGRWQPQWVASRTPVPAWLSLVAIGALGAVACRAARELVALAGELRAVAAAQHELARRGHGDLVVVDDAVPRSHAVSRTWRNRGRILLTSGMLELLDRDERAAVVAHERAHLRHAHAAFLVVMRLCVACDPLLMPVRADLRLALERWADEDAAEATGRPVVASAVAKAALGTRRRPGRAASAWTLPLHGHAARQRVAALLTEPDRRSWLAWTLVAVAAVSTVALLHAMHDTERLLEGARVLGRG